MRHFRAARPTEAIAQITIRSIQRVTCASPKRVLRAHDPRLRSAPYAAFESFAGSANPGNRHIQLGLAKIPFWEHALIETLRSVAVRMAQSRNCSLQNRMGQHVAKVAPGQPNLRNPSSNTGMPARIFRAPRTAVIGERRIGKISSNIQGCARIHQDRHRHATKVDHAIG